ncbi:histidine phosphatase family protein [Nocardioides insulae]|uniref:histidine phosphatase family protein n=1 Tax=Nocardioides insulae TaxID=394734 RepID=UPI0004075915|nr:histidine phosphatase family protein [Nocardioides insulae]
MRLILIRHGQTPANVAGALDTARPGSGLTGLGHAQARALPAALDAEAITGIYVSPLVRTQLTAEPLGAHLGYRPEIQEGFEEISAGDLEMLTDDGSRAAYAGCVATWLRGDLSATLPGAPDGHAFLERYDAAVAAVAAVHGPDETIAVVSHGAAIRSWVSLRAHLGEDEALHLGIMNTGAAFLEGRPGDWTLTRWSSDPLGGHLGHDELAHDITGESADEAAQELS